MPIPKGSKNSKNTTHGMSGTSTYNIWLSMMARCYKPTHAWYRNYGGRGITVCPRWHRFENFFEDMGTRPKGLTLEREDNDGRYQPSNCSWVTRSQQSRNRRSNINYTFRGKTQCLKDWATELGIAYSALYARIKRGKSFKEAIK